MNIQRLNQDLMALALPYVSGTDQVQGPGGNISVKGDNGEMMIKASGYRFEEITETGGFSVVNCHAIKNYFHTVNILDKQEEEKNSVALIMENVLTDGSGALYPKPSMETGFHAVLDKYVIHTHSVWSNLLNCCLQSKELLKAISDKLQIGISVIPYVSPGFGLSYLITQALKRAEAQQQKAPEVFFLINHGIIAHGGSIAHVQDLLKKTDVEIQNIFSLDGSFPSTDLKTLFPQSYEPADDYIQKRIIYHQADIAFFNQVIFPDQTVFFKDNISVDAGVKKKINIQEDGSILYHCGLREAKSIHETMTAYLFIYDQILSSGRSLRLIPESELDYINGMEMEKHRKSLM